MTIHTLKNLVRFLDQPTLYNSKRFTTGPYSALTVEPKLAAITAITKQELVIAAEVHLEALLFIPP